MYNQEILATVAGKAITNADLDAFLTNLPEEQKQFANNPYFREQYLEQLIIIHALCKMSEDMKFDQTPRYESMLVSAKRDIMARMAMEEIKNSVSVDEAEIKELYEANMDQFKKGATVSAKHILVENEGDCLSIMTQIKMGTKTFEEAAEEFSTCPSKANGGDLGEFGRGQMVKEFEDAAFAAEIGELVGPVQTQFGYHLILVENKSDESIIPFEEAAEQIRQSVLQQKQHNAYAEKVAELKEKYVTK